MTEPRVSDRGSAGATTFLNCLLDGGSPFGLLTGRDWDDVVRQAEKHGVAPVMYERLLPDAERLGVPARVMHALRAIAFETAVNNLRLYRDLSHVLRAVKEVGVDVIVLKGAFLAQAVYRSSALRPMYDVDLLVRRLELPRVESRLQELGYRALDHPKCAGMNYTTHHHSHPLVLADGPPIELHWAIARLEGGFSIDIDGLWRRAQPGRIAGTGALGLSPEDLLLHLCVHAAYDHRLLLGLRSVWDIRETLRHYEGRLDWESVQRRAQQWGVGKYVYVALRLARELLEARVPDEILAPLAPRDFDPRLMAWARAEVLSDESVVPSVPPRLARLWGSKGLRAKAQHFFQSVFPSPRAMAKMYPARSRSWRVYLYYPVRWKELVRLYGRSVLQLMGRRDRMVVEGERQNAKDALRAWLRS